MVKNVHSCLIMLNFAVIHGVVLDLTANATTECKHVERCGVAR